MNNRLGTHFGIVSLATLAVSGCDSRAGTDYAGTSLLHLEGRVVLPADAPSGVLQPVLTCAAASEEKMVILDVEAQGDFPSRFSLDLYAPLPAECADTPASWLGISGGKRFALLTISAMSAGHPDAIYWPATDPGLLDKSSDPRCAADPACEAVARWCVTDDGTEHCKTAYYGGCLPEDDEACVPLYTSGDPAVFMAPDDPGAFAGVSDDHLVVWTESGLPKSTVLAHVIGITEDLPAGYTLIALGKERPVNGCLGDQTGTCVSDVDTDKCAGEQCADPFFGEALQVYNQRHGTRYASETEIGLDASSEDEFDAATQEITDTALTLAVERGVDISAWDGSRVVHDPHAKLDLTLVPADQRVPLPL
jgi:hypothetical protein